MAKAYSLQQLQAKAASPAAQTGAETSNLPVPLANGGDLVPMSSSVAHHAVKAVSVGMGLGIQGIDGKFYPTPRGGSFGAEDRAPVIDLLGNDRVVNIRVTTDKAGESITIELHTHTQSPMVAGDKDILVGRVTYRKLENGQLEVDPQSLYVNPGYAGVRQRLAAEWTELGPERNASKERTSSIAQIGDVDRLQVVPDFAPSLKGLRSASSIEQRRLDLTTLMSHELNKVHILPVAFQTNNNAGEQFAFSAEHWAIRIDSLVLQSVLSQKDLRQMIDWFETRMRYAFVRAAQCWDAIRYMHLVLKLPTQDIERHFAKHAVAAAIADTRTIPEEARAKALCDSITSPQTTSALANVQAKNAERERLDESHNALTKKLNALKEPLTDDHLAQLDKARGEWHDAHLAAMKAADAQADLPHERAAWEASRKKAPPRKPER